MDAWFAGFQPTLAAVVWIGYDNPRKLGDRETGGGLALPVWIELMEHALKGVPVQELDAARGRGAARAATGSSTNSPRARGVGSVGLEDKIPEAPTDRRAPQHPRPVPPLNGTHGRGVPGSSGRAQPASNCSALPACALACCDSAAKNSLPSRVSSQRPCHPAVVVAAAARRQPHLVQRRLGVDDDLAAVGEAQLEQAAGALGVDVDHVVVQPAVGGGLDAGQQRVRSRGGTRRRSAWTGSGGGRAH